MCVDLPLESISWQGVYSEPFTNPFPRKGMETAILQHNGLCRNDFPKPFPRKGMKTRIELIGNNRNYFAFWIDIDFSYTKLRYNPRIRLQMFGNFRHSILTAFFS